jgi:nitrogen fixation/metabolism regulation signal transduction histidine kinase
MLTVPVPFFMVDVGWVPVARLCLLAFLCVIAAVSEPGFDTGYVAGLLATQALLAVVVTYVAARRLARWLERSRWGARRWAACAAIVVALFLIALLPIFHTPLSSTTTGTNLLGAFR